MTDGVATTRRQRDILSHTLGLDALRREPWRNAFCVEVGGEHEADVRALIAMGLMYEGQTINDGRDFYTHVTDAGKKEVMP